MKKILLLLGALSLLAGTASASIVVVDPFDQPPAVGAQNVCVKHSRQLVIQE